MTEYSALVLEHFYHPRQVGRLKNDKFPVKIGVAGGAHSGKTLHIHLCLNDTNRIENATFKAQGCVATLACGSWLAEHLIGKSFDEIKQINGIIIANALSLPAAKVHCALLAETALRDLIQTIEEEK